MEETSEKIDYKFKILTLGESAVGKTSILSQYNNNEFNPNLIATIGIDLIKKDIKIDGKTVRVQIWDTAGQERFYAITRNYFRNANGILLVFDMNELRTFKCIDRWHNEIIQEVDLNVPIFLIGNKMDLIENYDEIKKLFEEKAEKKNIKFFPVSAKTGDNVESIFNAMVREMILVSKDSKSKNRVLQFDDEEIKTTKCCGIIDIRKN